MNKTSAEKKGKFPRKYIWIGLLLGFVVLNLWMTTWIFMPKIYPNEHGTIGDMFGILNTLFSGLAFVALIITIWMQAEELSLQRIEFHDTKLALQGQYELLREDLISRNRARVAIKHVEFYNMGGGKIRASSDFVSMIHVLCKMQVNEARISEITPITDKLDIQCSFFSVVEKEPINEFSTYFIDADEEFRIDIQFRDNNVPLNEGLDLKLKLILVNSLDRKSVQVIRRFKLDFRGSVIEPMMPKISLPEYLEDESN